MLVPSPALAQSDRLFFEIDPGNSNGLITVSAEPRPTTITTPFTTIVTVSNNTGGVIWGAQGLWVGLKYKVVGNVQVETLWSPLTDLGILPPGGQSVYKVTFNGKGSVLLETSLSDPWPLVAFAVQNIARLIPAIGGKTDLAVVVAEGLLASDDFRNAVNCFIDVGSPDLDLAQRAWKSLGCAKEIVELVENEDRRTELAIFVWDKIGDKLVKYGIANPGELALQLKQLSNVYSVSKALVESAQMIGYGISGLTYGFVTVQALQSAPQQLNPTVSVSPSLAPSGTSFEAKWSGFTPSNTITQHLRAKDMPELPTAAVSTDSRGRAITSIDGSGVSPGIYELWGVDNRTSTASNRVEFTVTGEADLTTRILDVFPTSLVHGEKVSVTFNIQNGGNSASGLYSTWVSLSTAPNGTDTVLGKFPMISLRPGTSETATVNLAIPASVNTGEYYITVFADAPGTGVIKESNENNNIGSSSPNKLKITTDVSTVTLPSPPTHISPANGATGQSTTPLFQWNSVSGADYYGLYIKDITSGEGPIVFNSQSNYGNISGTSFSLPSGYLSAGKTYRWNMNSHNSAGWGTNYSSGWTFSTQLVTQITLTLYVHENSATGPLIVGAQVTGQDAAGNSFNQFTNSSGYVVLTGIPGTWSFTASKSGYQTNSWSQSITSTQTRHAFLFR